MPSSSTHDFSALWVVHDAVRRDLVRLVSLLGGTSPVRAQRRDALRAHWALVVGVLDAHEEAEDRLLWPPLRSVVPAQEQAVVDLVVGEHPGLSAALETASVALAAEDAFDVGPARDELTDALQRVAVLVDRHFGVEEQRLLPLVETHLDPSVWAGFVEGWLEQPGPGGPAAVLPFLLESAHRDRAAALLRAVDEADRTSYDDDWKSAHRGRVAPLW